MNHLIKKQEQLRSEQVMLEQQIKTCEAYQSVLFDFTASEGANFHRLTVEELLLPLHRLEINLRLEFFHLKLAQAFVACDIKHGEGVAK